MSDFWTKNKRALKKGVKDEEKRKILFDQMVKEVKRGGLHEIPRDIAPHIIAYQDGNGVYFKDLIPEKTIVERMKENLTSERVSSFLNKFKNNPKP